MEIAKLLLSKLRFITWNTALPDTSLQKVGDSLCYQLYNSKRRKLRLKRFTYFELYLFAQSPSWYKYLSFSKILAKVDNTGNWVAKKWHYTHKNLRDVLKKEEKLVEVKGRSNLQRFGKKSHRSQCLNSVPKRVEVFL